MWRAVRAFIANLFLSEEPAAASAPLPDPVDSNPPVTILCLLADHEDRSVVAALAAQNRWEVLSTEDIEQAAGISEQADPQIVLLDRDMAGQDWRKPMAALVAASSGACVVLVSKVLDDYLWNEVVCNGGYEVLPKPLREDEVFRTVRLARSYWTSANRWASGARK